MKRIVITLLLIGGAAFAADKAVPPTVQPLPNPDLGNPARTYGYCLDLARQQPDKGIEFAGRWIGLGGGEPAKHCQAIALIGLKAYGEAASRLEELANESKSLPDLRANMLAQAGQAWTMEGEYTRAYAAQTAGIALAPKGGNAQTNLYVDRAATLAEGAKYKEAVADLNAALAIRADNVDALVFRASARRHLNDPDGAFADVQAALKLQPKNANALVERGTLHALKKRPVEARRDWISAIQLAPDSDAADAARANIERLDLKPDGVEKK